MGARGRQVLNWKGGQRPSGQGLGGCGLPPYPTKRAIHQGQSPRPLDEPRWSSRWSAARRGVPLQGWPTRWPASSVPTGPTRAMSCPGHRGRGAHGGGEVQDPTPSSGPGPYKLVSYKEKQSPRVPGQPEPTGGTKPKTDKIPCAVVRQVRRRSRFALAEPRGPDNRVPLALQAPTKLRLVPNRQRGSRLSRARAPGIRYIGPSNRHLTAPWNNPNMRQGPWPRAPRPHAGSSTRC